MSALDLTSSRASRNKGAAGIPSAPRGLVKRKRRRRRPEGHVYQRGRIWWIKWVGVDRVTHYRSANSEDRAVAEQMLRTELQRKARGQKASADPRRCLVDDLLESLLAKYRTEGRRSCPRA